MMKRLLIFVLIPYFLYAPPSLDQPMPLHYFFILQYGELEEQIRENTCVGIRDDGLEAHRQLLLALVVRLIGRATDAELLFNRCPLATFVALHTDHAGLFAQALRQSSFDCKKEVSNNNWDHPVHAACLGAHPAILYYLIKRKKCSLDPATGRTLKDEILKRHQQNAEASDDWRTKCDFPANHVEVLFDDALCLERRDEPVCRGIKDYHAEVCKKLAARVKAQREEVRRLARK